MSRTIKGIISWAKNTIPACDQGKKNQINYKRIYMGFLICMLSPPNFVLFEFVCNTFYKTLININFEGIIQVTSFNHKYMYDHHCLLVMVIIYHVTN